MTIQELIKRASAQSNAPADQSTDEALMLIVGECSRALEAHKAKLRAKKEDVHILWIGDMAVNISDPGWARVYQKRLINSVEDHLSNVAILIADLCGRWDYLLDERDLMMEDGFDVARSLLGVVVNVTSRNRDIGSTPSVAALSHGMNLCFGIARGMNIDLWKHIELKFAYSEALSKQWKA